MSADRVTSAALATAFGLPLSMASSAASSSACSRIRSPILCRRRPRADGVMRAQGPLSKARRAAFTAKSTSALSPSATRATTSPVAGSVTSKVLPDWAGTHLPSIRRWRSFDSHSWIAGGTLGETAGMSARMFIGDFSLRSSSSAISSSAASTGTSCTGASVEGPSVTEAAASKVTTWVLCPEAQFPARHNGCVCGATERIHAVRLQNGHLSRENDRLYLLEEPFWWVIFRGLVERSGSSGGLMGRSRPIFRYHTYAHTELLSWEWGKGTASTGMGHTELSVGHACCRRPCGFR